MPYLRVKNELPLIPGYSEGVIAYAPDAAEAPLNECICYINPEQSGSGDPSPDNVRPITGHTELNLVQKDGNDTVVHTYTTDFGTTVYGGTLDVVSGVLTVTKEIVDLGNLSWSKDTTTVSGKTIFRSSLSAKSQFNAICSNYNFVGAYTNLTDKTCCYIYNTWIGIEDSTYNESTVGQFKTAMNGVQLVYELATPITIQLTPQEVKSLLGVNNFYHDCNGDTKITYIRRLDS